MICILHSPPHPIVLSLLPPSTYVLGVCGVQGKESGDVKHDFSVLVLCVNRCLSCLIIANIKTTSVAIWREMEGGREGGREEEGEGGG